MPGIAEDVLSPGLRAVYGSLSLVSFSVVVLLVYVGTEISRGPVFPQHSAYFFAACALAFAFPALGVFLYYKLRDKTAPHAKKLLLITTWSLIPAFLSLTGGALEQNPGGRSARDIRHSGDLVRSSEKEEAAPVIRDKWDQVTVQFLSDVRAFNEQYISEVSKTESDLPKLLTIDSFRDAATIEQELSRVQALLDINQKYASFDLLDRVRGYVDSVKASREEKRQFLEKAAQGAQSFLAQRKRVSALERTWLLTSHDLYQFALAHESEYAVKEKNLVFRNNAALEAFRTKFNQARAQYADFLEAYHELRNSQDSVLAQTGPKQK